MGNVVRGECARRATLIVILSEAKDLLYRLQDYRWPE
jgi:hypothetical protein